MRVDRAYKGVSEEFLDLYDDGMCDGPELRIGEQYLMYTRRFGTGAIPARGCTRSRHVRYAKEDLEYLNGMANAEAKASIFGKVLERTDDYYGDDKALVGASVAVSGPTGKLIAVSDASGRYSFTGLEPAEYTVSADQPGYYRHSPISTGRLEARGCAAIDILLRKERKGSLRGQVLRANGEPAPEGMRINLIRMSMRDGRERWNALFEPHGTTKQNGGFQIDAVQPGRYKVVLNLYEYPTARAPYPTIYWPNERSESNAKIIEIGDGASGERFDFRLPPEPQRGIVKGIVFATNGRPAAGVNVAIKALPNNSSSATEANRKKTDAEGGFSFEVLSGFEYKLRAWGSGVWTHSKEVEYSLEAGPEFITLTLEEHSPPVFPKRP